MKQLQAKERQMCFIPLKLNQKVKLWLQLHFRNAQEIPRGTVNVLKSNETQVVPRGQESRWLEVYLPKSKTA